MANRPHQPSDITFANPAKWLDAHGDYLFSYALVRVRSTEVAEDLVQETLLAALQRARTFRHESSVRTWLVAILKHKLIDYRRRTTVGRESESKARAHPRLGERVDDDPLAHWVDGQFDARGKWRDPPEHWRRFTPGDSLQLSPSERMNCTELWPVALSDYRQMHTRQSS